jgi:hypothetical protein
MSNAIPSVQVSGVADSLGEDKAYAVPVLSHHRHKQGEMGRTWACLPESGMTGYLITWWQLGGGDGDGGGG